jgi:hypothetical protein
MIALKPISLSAAPAALERAERYRLLNEPLEAESICRDILAVDPGNQQALVMLVLSLTDQFDTRLTAAYQEANHALTEISDAYAQAYFGGVICERRAKAHFARGSMGAGNVAHEWFQQALESYEKAEAIRPPNNDEALLRWNTVARIIDRHPELAPRHHEPAEHMLE